MARTLMLNLAGRAVPFAYQVPDQAYQDFKHLQNTPELDPCVIRHIDAYCKRILKNSIKQWEKETRQFLRARALAEDVKNHL